MKYFIKTIINDANCVIIELSFQKTRKILIVLEEAKAQIVSFEVSKVVPADVWSLLPAYLNKMVYNAYLKPFLIKKF